MRNISVEDFCHNIITTVTTARELYRTRSVLTQLDHIILGHDGSNLDETLVFSRLGLFRETIQHEYAAHELALEHSFVHLIAQLDEPWWIFDMQSNITHPYLSRYRRLIEREVRLADVSRRDRVVWMGSGPLPTSSIFLTSLTGCHIDCLDLDSNAVQTSKNIVNLLRLDDKIRVFESRGEEWDLSDYTVVIVGILANPAIDIIHNIIRTGMKDARIVVRSTFGLRQLIYPPKHQGLPDLHQIRMDIASGDQVISPILMRLE